VFLNSAFTQTLCWPLAFSSSTGSTGRLGCCSPGTFMAEPNLNTFSKATACEACPVGQYGSTVDDDITSCTTCATVSNSFARTCNAGGASGIQTVTCNTGFHESGSAGVDLGCTACDNQANCVTSTPNTCSTTAGITTKTPCASVTAPGYFLDDDKVTTCATSGNGTNAATVTCTDGTDQVATTCNAGYGLIGSACGACDAFTYAVQGNSAVCQTCATSGNGANAATITCTSGTNQIATDCNAGYGLVGSACVACDAFTFAVQGNSAVCQTCASGSYTDTGTGTTGTTCSTCDTSGLGANAATVMCTNSTNQIATDCNAGYVLDEDACSALITKADVDTAYSDGVASVIKCSLADQLVDCDSTQLAEIARHYKSRGQC